MLALQLLGPHLGVTSALVVSSLTLVSWNHPYAILIFTAEAAVVALLTSRRVEFVMADAIYWCVIGIARRSGPGALAPPGNDGLLGHARECCGSLTELGNPFASTGTPGILVFS